MWFIDAERVHASLDYASLVDWLRRQHQEDVEAVEDMLLEQPARSGARTHFLARAAWQRGRAFGIKLATVFPDNEATGTGLPNIQGTYVLFDGGNGKPEAIIDGTALTLWKTVADSALGARFLARQDARTMLMVGAGALAPHLIPPSATARRAPWRESQGAGWPRPAPEGTKASPFVGSPVSLPRTPPCGPRFAGSKSGTGRRSGPRHWPEPCRWTRSRLLPHLTWRRRSGAPT